MLVATLAYAAAKAYAMAGAIGMAKALKLQCNGHQFSFISAAAAFAYCSIWPARQRKLG